MNHEVEKYEGELRELREQVRMLCTENKDYVLIAANKKMIRYNSNRPIKQILADLPYEVTEVYARIL
jgi:hypothetical protein